MVTVTQEMPKSDELKLKTPFAEKKARTARLAG